ncbi:glycosyltransferase family 39 protein [Nitrospinaceae bacterium]|nr:glycosyltransferase family 39 protein [Nitrospinaceae bacterium]
MLLDIRPPSYDQGLHLFRTFNYWEAMSSGSEDWWQDILNVEPFYPPFYHLSLIPLSLIFGFTLDTGVIGNSFYMVIMALSIYGIGKILYTKNVGLIAAFLVSCYPLIVNMSREYIISVMLTAMTTLAYYLFLKSENFENKKYSILFSFIYAGGLMVKWTFFIYTLPAVLAGLWGGKIGLKDRIIQSAYYMGMVAALLIVPFFILIIGEQLWIPLILEFVLILTLVINFAKASLSTQKTINLVSLSCISVLICFPWYAHNLINILIGFSKFAFPSSVLKGSMAWDLPIWGYYLEVISRQMGYPLMAIFVITFFLYIFKKDRFNWTLFGWAILPIIVFTFVNNKGARYTMPSLPAMALITAVVLNQIKNIPLRKFLYSITGVITLGTILYTGFIPKPTFLPYFGKGNLPITQIWPINSMLDDIIEEAKPEEGEHVVVRTLANFAYFQRGAFRDFAAFRGLPIAMKGVKRNTGEMTDFFITRDGDFSRQSSNAINARNLLTKDPALTKTFKLFRSYPLPDGNKGLLYKFDMEPANSLPSVTDLKLVGKRLKTAFSSYPIYGVKNGVNMDVSITPTNDPQDIYYGRYKSIQIKADSVVSNKILIKNFELLFENVQINIYDLLLNGKFILFNLERLTPRGTIHFDDLEKLAEQGIKGKGTIKVSGSRNSITLKAKYFLSQSQIAEGETKISILFSPGEKIQPVFEYLKLGPFNIPTLFIRRITNAKMVLTPTPKWPLETNIQSLKISTRKIEINPDI